jgi:RNA polymerase sigma factor (sigma-70 family)
MAVCRAYSSDPEDAKEILNDGFLKVFKHLKNLKNQETLLPWLRQIMVNTALDSFRKKQNKQVERWTENQPVAEPYLNEEGVLAQISAEEILVLLQRLPPAPRVVFGLYVLEGYSHQEIALQMGIGESTSRAYLSEANKQLRRALTQNQQNDERIRR